MVEEAGGEGYGKARWAHIYSARAILLASDAESIRQEDAQQSNEHIGSQDDECTELKRSRQADGGSCDHSLRCGRLCGVVVLEEKERRPRRWRIAAEKGASDS